MARFRSSVGTVLLVVMMILPSVGNLQASSAALNDGQVLFTDVVTVTAQPAQVEVEPGTPTVFLNPSIESVPTTEPVVVPTILEPTAVPTELSTEPEELPSVTPEVVEEQDATDKAPDPAELPTITPEVVEEPDATDQAPNPAELATITPAPVVDLIADETNSTPETEFGDKNAVPGSELPEPTSRPATEVDSGSTPPANTITNESAMISLSHSSGPAGAQITITGVNFTPGEEIPVCWSVDDCVPNPSDSNWRGSPGVLPDGTFRMQIGIPADASPGVFTIYAEDIAGETASTAFTVTESSIDVDPKSGAPGAEITIIGVGLLPGDEVNVKWGSIFAWPLITDTVQPDGSFSVSVKIPNDSTPGTTTIYVQSGWLAFEIEFEVVNNPQNGAPTMTVNPATGKPQDRIQVTGSNFEPGKRVNIRWGSATGPIIGYRDATSTGAFSGAVLVPTTASAGPSSIWLQGETATASAMFEVVGSPEPKVSLSPSSGKQGDRVSISGANFPPGEIVNIRWGSASGPTIGYKNATSSGTFSGAILVPATAPSGSTSIYLVNGDEVASVVFTVTAAPKPTASVSPSIALPGARITVTGTNFKPGERVNVRWGSASGPVLGYKNATSTGVFSGAVLVPSTAPARTTSIYLQSASGTDSVQFTVKSRPAPTATVSPTTALPGAKVVVSGSNFKPSERVNVRWGSASGPIIGYKNATSSGTFSGAVLIPSTATAGTTSIYLQSASGTISARFTVKPRPRANVSISNTYGTFGDTIGITGWNFQPGEQVTITFPGNKVVGRVTVRSDGTFSGRIMVPPTAAIGYNTITSRGGSSGFNAGIRYEVFEFLYADVSVTTEALPGALVGFSGSGFRPGEVIYVVGNTNEMIGNVTATGGGTISGTFFLSKDISIGSHLIQFGNADVTYYAEAYIKVIPWTLPTLNIPANMSPGQFIHISGSGFGPNEVVQIYSVEPFRHIATVTSNPAGKFSGYTFAPNLYGGYLYIEAEGQGTGRWVRVMVYMRFSHAPISKDDEYANTLPPPLTISSST